MMLFRHRPDGHPIKVPGFTRLMPMLTGSRTASTIFLEESLHLDTTFEFMSTYNRNRPPGRRRLSILQLFLCAIARTVSERPKMNRFVMNYRYYQRNHISAAFVTKTTLEEDAEEVNVIIPLDPDDTVDSVNARFTDYVNRIKSGGTNASDQGVDLFGSLPTSLIRLIAGGYRFLDNHNLMTRGMLRILPMYSTVFLADLGSIGLDCALHHLFDLGTNGIFVTLGKVKREHHLTEDGAVDTRRALRIAFSYDERIIDGLYAGTAIRRLKRYVEDPSLLTVERTTSPDERKRIGLTERGSRLFVQE